jgi:hypothetical protein
MGQSLNSDIVVHCATFHQDGIISYFHFSCYHLFRLFLFNLIFWVYYRIWLVYFFYKDYLKSLGHIYTSSS